MATPSPYDGNEIITRAQSALNAIQIPIDPVILKRFTDAHPDFKANDKGTLPLFFALTAHEEDGRLVFEKVIKLADKLALYEDAATLEKAQSEIAQHLSVLMPTTPTLCEQVTRDISKALTTERNELYGRPIG